MVPLPSSLADYDHSDWLIQPQAVLIINRGHAELDETDVVTFQDKACQLAGGKGAGIDVDAISADVRFSHGRVAVDNRFFEAPLCTRNSSRIHNRSSPLAWRVRYPVLPRRGQRRNRRR